MKLRSLALSLLAVMHFVPGVLGAPGAPAAESYPKMTIEEYLGRPSMRGLVEQLQRMSGGRAFERRGDLVLIAIGGWADPIGDLTGDGVDEVATTRLQGGQTSFSTSIDILSGKTGKSLFAEPLEVSGFAFPMRARVGPDADWGLLIGAFDFRSSGPMWIENVEISAVTANGETLWSRDYIGYEQLDGWWVEVNMVHGFATLDMTGGKQTDVAVHLSDGTSGAPQDVARARVVLVDGADGSEVTGRDYALEKINWGTLSRLPDMDRDGKDELLVAMRRTKDSPGWIEALTAASADPLWRTEGRFVGYSFIEKVADVAGGKGPELILQSWGPEGVFVLDGLTGKLVSRSNGSFSGAPGDIDGNGRADIVYTEQLSRYRSPRIAQRVWAETGTGKVLWEVGLRSKVEPFGNISSFAGAWNGGDVDEDGLRDIEATHVVTTHDDYDFRTLLERRHVIDASTGKEIARGAYQLLSGSLDGEGADMVTTRTARKELSISVRDGLTGRGLWSRELSSPGRDPLASTSVLERPGPSEALLVTIQGNNGEIVYVLDGPTGHLLWKKAP